MAKKGAVGKKADLQPPAVFDIQKEADATVLAKYGPAGFVINEAMRILQFRGDTSPYLRPAPGQASLDLLKMVREDLVAELRAALHLAKKESVPVNREKLRVKQGKLIKYINLDVTPLRVPVSGERCFLVLFEETPPLPLGEKKGAAKSVRTEQGESRGRRDYPIETGTRRVKGTFKHSNAGV